MHTAAAAMPRRLLQPYYGVRGRIGRKVRPVERKGLIFRLKVIALFFLKAPLRGARGGQIFPKIALFLKAK